MATSSNPDKPAKSENPDKPTISQDTAGASPEMAESGISTKTEGKEGSTKSRLVLREFAGKPFWDWLDLFSKLAIPVVVLIVTIWFSLWQNILAGQQHKADMTRALDAQQAAILDTYIGTMRNLLLNHALSTSRPGDEVRQVAREQTLVTLLRLNAKRNRTVLQFLQDAHLFGTADAIINLSNADLSKAALDGAHLGGVTLIGADLSHTDLSGADLSGAVMYGANLAGAGLRNATLASSSLTDALLEGAHLAGAHLSNALLTSAVLTGAQLQGATLTAARLNGAELTHANLSGANLSGADLTAAHLHGAELTGVADLSNAGMAGADLSRADLSRADLSDANLSTANLSGADLAGADLAGANLRGANLAGANLSGANLAGAKLHGARRRAASAGSAPSSCTSASPPAGLASQHHPPVKLTYWDTESGREATVAHKLIRQFVQAHPDIKVCAVPKPFLQTQAAFATAVQGPQAPDVLRCDVGWTTRFASKGYLLNIDSFVSRTALSDYLSAPLKYDKYQGHLYGLPQVTDFLALLYDKAELRRVGINQPPATMAALKADAVKVVERRVAKYGFETSGTSYYALPFLYAFGGGMFDRHNNILVGSSGSVNGLKFLLKLENNPHHVMPPKINIDNGPADMLNDFMYGRTAMIFDGPYSVSGLLNTRRSKFKGHPGKLGVAAIPRGPAGQTGSPLGGQSYVISAATRHPAEAYKFISFMSSPASQSAISRANLTLPTRRSAYRGKVSSNLFIKEFHRISDTAIARPAIPQGAYLFDMFDPNIWAALVGVQGPGEALSAVADSWDQFGAGQVPAPTR